jgi:dCTP deaminase
LTVQNTVIEPGWRGYLTLELTNHGPNRLEIPAGSPIAQIIFEMLDEPTEQPYRGPVSEPAARARRGD